MSGRLRGKSFGHSHANKYQLHVQTKSELRNIFDKNNSNRDDRAHRMALFFDNVLVTAASAIHIPMRS